MKHLVIFLSFIGFSSSHLWADEEAIHGMLLFGDKTTYVSHFPMYHKPHNYQLILEVELENTNHANSHVVEEYHKSKKNGQSYFSLAPNLMDLAKVISGEIKSFHAKLFAGHFEKEGSLFFGFVKVIIKRKIYSETLVKEQYPSDEFLVFGEDGEYYAAHVIKGIPSYDALYKVSQPMIYKDPEAEGWCRTITCRPWTLPVPDYQLPVTIEGDMKYLHKAPTKGGFGFGWDKPSTVIQKVLHIDYADLKD